MKKLLLVLPIFALFAAGCNVPQQASSVQIPSPTQTQAPVVQNSNLPSATPSPAATLSPTQTPTPVPSSSIHINSLIPTSGPVGTRVTVTGSGFTPTGDMVNFSSGTLTNISSSANNTTVTFSVPESVGPSCPPGKACPMFMLVVTPGTYSVSVTNGNGATSNTLPFTVTSGSGEMNPY